MKKVKVIAIDPDMRKSGVAYIAENGEVIDLQALSISQLSDVIHAYHNSVIYAIEDVNKHGTVYRHNRKGGASVQARIAQNIGMVKAAGVMIIDVIESATGRKPVLAPLGIGKQTKRNAKLFNQLTGWQGKTNEDTRDAACIGRWVAAQLRKGWAIDSRTGQLVVPDDAK